MLEQFYKTRRNLIVISSLLAASVIAGVSINTGNLFFIETDNEKILQSILVFINILLIFEYFYLLNINLKNIKESYNSYNRLEKTCLDFYIATPLIYSISATVFFISLFEEVNIPYTSNDGSFGDFFLIFVYSTIIYVIISNIKNLICPPKALICRIELCEKPKEKP